MLTKGFVFTVQISHFDYKANPKMSKRSIMIYVSIKTTYKFLNVEKASPKLMINKCGNLGFKSECYVYFKK